MRSDNNGPYYWHIKSGTIQREPPIWSKEQPLELKTPIGGHHFLASARCTSNSAQFGINGGNGGFYGGKDGNRIQVSISRGYISG